MKEKEIMDKDSGQIEFSILNNDPKLSAIKNYGWLTNPLDRKKLIEAPFFKKIIKNKIFDKPLPPEEVIDHTVINALHILGRCNNPNLWEIDYKKTNWKVLNEKDKYYQNNQGLVYGMVQSGKTASMLTLMGLAHTSGFNLLILLSSDKESLRNQTQDRINKTFNLKNNGQYERMEYDSNTDEAFYNGVDANVRSLTLISQPENGITGDYVKQTSELIENLKLGYTMIICIKKNVTILKKLLNDLKTVNESNPSLYNKIKALIVDDEADYGSQNTKKNLTSPLHDTIAEIRKVLNRNSFVQYTATPQACLAADPKLLVGYPRDFLWLLDVYRNDNGGTISYLGHNEFFNDYFDDLVVKIDPRSWPHYLKDSKGKKIGIRDYDGKIRNDIKLQDLEEETLEVFINSPSKRNEVCGDYQNAIIDFLITCAIRWFRYYEKKYINQDLPEKSLIKASYPHHAMIFNLAYKTKHHNELMLLIEKIYNHTKTDFFENDIMDLDNKFNIQYQKQHSKSVNFNNEIPSLDRLKYFIELAINISSEKIQGTQDFIYKLNSKDDGQTVEYENVHSLNYTKKAAIFIGGHILGRGLTVKNLSTSVFIRSQVKSLGDTNLQMCRWFGHKKKDADITSLYINDENLELFQAISNADNELRNEFWESIHTNQNPECFLISLQSNNLFFLTSPGKSRFLEKENKSYAGQSRHLQWPKKHKNFEMNSKILDDFLDGKKYEFMHGRADVYYDIDNEEFKLFFKELKIEDFLTNISPSVYIDYLNRYNTKPPSINIAVYGKDGDLRTTQNTNGLYINPLGGPKQRENYKFMGDKYIDKDVSVHENMDKSGIKYERDEKDNILIIFWKLNQLYKSEKHETENPDYIKSGNNLSPLILYSITSPKGGPSTRVYINKEIKEERDRIIEKCKEYN